MKKLAVVSSCEYFGPGTKNIYYKLPGDSDVHSKNIIVDIYDSQTNTMKRVRVNDRFKEFYFIGDVVEYDDELKTITNRKKLTTGDFIEILRIKNYYQNYFSIQRLEFYEVLKKLEELSLSPIIFKSIKIDPSLYIKPLSVHEIELILIGLNSAIFDMNFHTSLVREIKIPGTKEAI